MLNQTGWNRTVYLNKKGAVDIHENCFIKFTSV